MYKENKILALIPARGGSKGIPGKNIKELAGKPLIAYSIEAAKGCSYVDDVVVTTDSQEIADVAERFGAAIPCLRPEELACDQAKTIEAILHMVNYLKEQGQNYDWLVLLQPTSPLRTAEDLAGAIELAVEKNDEVVGISEVTDSPILMRTIDENNQLEKMMKQNSTVRRQDMPKFYRVNGSIYINKIENLSAETSFNDNPIGYVLSKEHSVDIDEMTDFVVAEYYLRQK